MGIDLEKKKRGRVKVPHRRFPRSNNIYLKLTHQLYSFLARRTNSAFNRTVEKRLAMSRNSRPPLALGKIVTAHFGRPKAIIVAVCTVTDDTRILKIPKISLCALRVTETARKKIIANGGEVLTFDQLALRAPLGRNTCLLRGPLKARAAYRNFNGKPRTLSKGRKFEKGPLTKHLRTRNKGKVKTT